jgi:light-regulated signal transduction histidine kinase (bacteriophytochrome)
MSVDLTNCDREPIHIIGRIQSFGYLLAVSSDWIVTFVSANLCTIAGIDATALIGGPAIALLSENGIHTLRTRLQLLTTETSVERILELDLFGQEQLFDVALHRSGRNIVIEAEPSDTSALAKFVSYVRPMTERIRQASSVQAMCDLAARQMRALTGFDRVMIYRFSGYGAGEVLSESCGHGIDSFLGMHFPGSDIPLQARALYMKNLLRLIADIADPTVPILPALGPGGQPLDLTMSTLRAVSPIHIEYLGNMGVQASMSASIVRGGKLWGLFACHHYQPLILTYPVRTAAELFAEMFAFLLDQAERTQSEVIAAKSARVRDTLMGRLADGGSLISNFDNFATSIAEVIPYDGIAAWIDGQIVSHGAVPQRADFVALMDFLNTAASSRVWATDCLAHAYPPASAYSEQSAGLLALPVSRKPGDLIVLFRREVAKNVAWAGNPEKLAGNGPNGLLSPRKSFARYNETVAGHCLEWTEDQQHAAETMRITLLEVVLRLTDAANMERDRASRQREFLIAELNHRVRNILGLVRSLVTQSQTGAGSVADFARNIGERIQSLARAHDLLTNAQQTPVSLRQLVSTEARAYVGTGGDTSVMVSGGDAMIAPRAVTTMTLVLHELMTNARKYGALSQPGGKVAIGMARADAGDLALRWEETGGPPVSAPTRRGFGSTILERALPHELGGTAAIEYHTDGVVAQFVLPAQHLVEFTEVDPPLAQAPSPASADGAGPGGGPAAPGNFLANLSRWRGRGGRRVRS